MLFAETCSADNYDNESSYEDFSTIKGMEKDIYLTPKKAKVSKVPSAPIKTGKPIVTKNQMKEQVKKLKRRRASEFAETRAKKHRHQKKLQSKAKTTQIAREIVHVDSGISCFGDDNGDDLFVIFKHSEKPDKTRQQYDDVCYESEILSMYSGNFSNQFNTSEVANLADFDDFEDGEGSYFDHEFVQVCEFPLKVTRMIESGRNFSLQEILDAVDVPGDVESLESECESLFDPMLGEVRVFRRTGSGYVPLYESNEIETIVRFLFEQVHVCLCPSVCLS